MGEMNQELNQALSSLVQYGVSDELIALIRAIEETTDTQGKPVYDPGSIYELRSSILCRNYGKTLWEFCHFSAVLEHLSVRGICDLFWLQEVTTGYRLKHWINQLDHPSWLLVRSNTSISIKLGERVFNLNPKRANLMAAWTGFISFIDPSLLGLLTQFKNEMSDRSVDAFCKQLKAKLDQYLDGHLQAIHQQRQGRILLSWVQSQEATNTLTDQRVLDFWQQQACLDEGDFKRFSTVAECAFKLHKAITLGENRTSLNATQSYDQDQFGESASWLLDEVAQLDDNNGQWLFDTLAEEHESDAIEQLSRSPLDEIKFLTNKDTIFCESLERAGAAVHSLPLTYLRAQTFAAQQAKITEDLRKTKGKNSQSLSEFDDFSGAEKWVTALQDQQTKLSLTRKAIGHVLMQHSHPSGLANIIEQLGSEDRAIFSQRSAANNHSMLSEEQMVNIKRLVAVPIKEAEKAYAKVNRTGFKELPEQEQTEIFHLGDQCLSQLEQLLEQYHTNLIQITKHSGGLAQQEQLDRAIFGVVFTQLYCANGVSL